MNTNKCMYTIQFVIAALVAIFVFGSSAWAATYYVDASNGNDNSDGLSPSSAWMTISKINNASFASGDSILFKRGETWKEQLTVPSSGSSGNPITFGDYGSGEKPIIDGEKTRDHCINNLVGRDFITFKNLHLMRANKDNLIGWEAVNIIVEDVDLEYADRHNAFFGGGSHNLVIRRCSFHHAAVEHGIYVDASNYPLIEYSAFHNNKRSGIHFNSGGGVSDVKNPIVRYNTFHSNIWCGIDDYAGSGGKYYYNLFYDNSGYCIGLDSDWEGRDLPSKNNEIYNNTIYQHTTWGDPIVSIMNNSTGHIIKNNIISRGNNNDILIRIDAGCSATVDNNVYYGTSMSRAFEYHEVLYDSLSSWQAASNQDAHSIAADPEFNNVNGHDFTLKETSPCIGAGSDVGLATDMVGTSVPIGFAVDIGAFEHDHARPKPPTGLQVF